MLTALANLHPTRRSQRAISLVELIIAMTVFLMLLSSGIVMVSQVSQAAKKVEMEEYLHTEGQALIERLAREIQNAGLDYEEYYSQKVLQAAALSPTYGDNYGEYHKRFFHPGYATPPNTAGPYGGYGAYCVNGATFDTDTYCDPSYPLTSTFDFDTGSNPYGGSTSMPETANAVCDTTNCSTDPLLHELDELYLINHAGNLKTIYALKTVSTVKRLAFIQLDGTDADGNGISESWACTSDFTCTTALPTNINLVPVSPKNLAIQWIKFYISPIEDPFKGYNETTNTTFQSVQLKPRVTIVMNARYQLYDPSGAPIDFDQTKSYIGEPPEITFQTTVGTGVNDIVPAYSFP